MVTRIRRARVHTLKHTTSVTTTKTKKAPPFRTLCPSTRPDNCNGSRRPRPDKFLHSYRESSCSHLCYCRTVYLKFASELGQRTVMGRSTFDARWADAFKVSRQIHARPIVETGIVADAFVYIFLTSRTGPLCRTFAMKARLGLQLLNVC